MRVRALFQLHRKLLEAERQLGEVHGRLKEQRQLSGEKLLDKEQQVADLQLKLSRLEEQVGPPCRRAAVHTRRGVAAA